MLVFNDLTLQRGDLRLLQKTNLSLHQGWKVGLTGANGAGKSSLFKLLLGELSPDAGTVELHGYQQIAHLAQETPSLNTSALDYVLEGHAEFTRLEQELALAQAAGDNTALANLYSDYDLIHGYSKRAEAEQLLAGLGFTQANFKQPVSSFSGGWRIRLNLARTLFTPSDLLLLDEPTNHLDLDATLWLEGWLKAYQGTLILISHDRDFLDNLVSHLVHLEHQQLNLYTGNYSAFERQRAERLALQQAMHVKQQRQIEHMESFIRRFKAKATKAKQAQSRIKALERMEKIAPAHVDSQFSFNFLQPEKFSDPLVNLNQASLGYATTQVLSDVNFALHPGQRIGLLGPNGAGKSTLVKSLVGSLPLLSGHRIAGENLQLGYFAQHQLEALDVNATPLLHLQRLSTKPEQEMRNFLGGFGFHGDAVLAPVSRFSGGEKARLALALITWQKPNLLLLDEPTNHLDLEMRQALALALQDFEGAILIIAHDRHLLNSCVDEFYLVADGALDEFAGDLDDYASWLKQRQTKSVPSQEPKPQPIADKPTSTKSASAPKTTQNNTSNNRKQERQAAAQLRAQLRPLRKKVEQLEEALEKNLLELEAIELQLAEGELYTQASRKEELQQLLKHQGQLQLEQAAIEGQWLEASSSLEEASLDF